jgi:hypothetical protein
MSESCKLDGSGHVRDKHRNCRMAITKTKWKTEKIMLHHPFRHQVLNIKMDADFKYF